MPSSSAIAEAPAARFRGVPAEQARPHPSRPDVPVLPHLTWLFVSPWNQRHGIGNQLLEGVVQALRELKHDALASTFEVDNAASTCWLWRRGFTLTESR